MACSTCSGHGVNGGINAKFARDVTLKRNRDQYEWILFPYSQVYELGFFRLSDT